MLIIVEYRQNRNTYTAGYHKVPYWDLFYFYFILTIYHMYLSYVSCLLFSLLFADDSNMFLSGKNPTALIDTMNTEIEKVLEWLDINKLTLNVKKRIICFSENLKQS